MTHPKSLTIQQRSYPIKVILLPKKNSSASIKNGEIVLRLSKYLSKKQKQEHIEELLAKISKKLKHNSSSPGELDLEDGNVIEVFGERLMLHLIYKPDAKATRIRSKKQAIFITHGYGHLSQTNRADLLKKLRRKLALKFNPELDRYVHELNRKTVNSRKFKQARFKEQSSRWGSCSFQGNINISSRLLFLPTELLEYVCLHELCHLKHPNHSDRFWQLVEQHIPDFKKRKIKLKNYL